MIRRCKHLWAEESRVYTEPVIVVAARAGMSKINTGTFLNQDAADRAIHGFTTIVLVCMHCGDVKVHYPLGNVPAPVDAWRDPGKASTCP